MGICRGRAHTIVSGITACVAPHFLLPSFDLLCELAHYPRLPLAGKGKCHHRPRLAAPVSAVEEKIPALLRLPQRRKMAEPPARAAV